MGPATRDGFREELPQIRQVLWIFGKYIDLTASQLSPLESWGFRRGAAAALTDIFFNSGIMNTYNFSGNGCWQIYGSVSLTLYENSTIKITLQCCITYNFHMDFGLGLYYTRFLIQHYISLRLFMHVSIGIWFNSLHVFKSESKDLKCKSRCKFEILKICKCGPTLIGSIIMYTVVISGVKFDC